MILSFKNFSNDEIFIFCITLTFFVLVCTFIFIKNQNIPVINSSCLKIQKFCFENQVLVFSVFTFICFLVSLLELAVCDSLIGLAFMFNGVRLCHFLYRENLYFIQYFLFLMIGYRYVNNPHIFNYFFVFGLIFYYYWYLVGLIINLPTLEGALKKLKEFPEQQRPSLEHMQTKLLFFFLLEQVVFVYFGIRLTLGGDALSTLIGVEISTIISFYMHISFAACLLARLITIIIFNPNSELKVQLLGLGIACIGLVFTFFKM